MLTVHSLTSTMKLRSRSPGEPCLTQLPRLKLISTKNTTLVCQICSDEHQQSSGRGKSIIPFQNHLQKHDLSHSPQILEQIFQLLPVDDLKCASAVCFTWSQIAFSWPCMQNVQLKVAVSSFEDGVVPEVLETTGRRFRHVCLRVDRPIIDQPHRLELISEVLLKFGESIESLRFIWDVEDETFDLNSMLTVLRYVPCLKELKVEDFIDRRDELAAVMPAITVESLLGLERVNLPHSLMDNEQFNLAELAPNLLHLSAEFKGRHPWEAIWLLSGQLYSLSIRTETENNFQPLWQIDPSSLRRLRLSRLCCDLGDINDVKLDDARCFFFQCTAITVLKLELHVSLAVIRVIAENCSLLRELLVYDVDDGWQLLVILQRLERLTSLTVAEASFEGADSDIYQIRLPNLVELVLDAIYLEEPTKFFIVLDQIVPNLKFLQVSNYNRFDSDSYNLDILKSLFRAKLQSLESLILCDYVSNVLICCVNIQLIFNFRPVPFRRICSTI